jgi:PhnB protein
MLNIDSVAEADRVFDALSAHGTVQIPLQESFWAQRFGVLGRSIWHALDD